MFLKPAMLYIMGKGNFMKSKIKKEALEMYGSIERHDEESIADFLERVMDKTTDALIEEIKNQLKNEFAEGTLKHNFIISPEYYLDLKLKEVKMNFFKTNQNNLDQL